MNGSDKRRNPASGKVDVAAVPRPIDAQRAGPKLLPLPRHGEMEKTFDPFIRGQYR